MKIIYPAKIALLIDRVLGHGAARRAWETVRREEPGSTPLDLYLWKTAREAYRVTDADVASVRAEGATAGAIFEATVGAALSAGALRLEHGLRAIDEA